MMKSLVGSEKQVAWAGDIRAGKEKVVAVLREAIAIMEDCTMVSVPDQSLFGEYLETIHEVCEKNLSDAQKAWLTAATPWFPGEGLYPEIDCTTRRAAQYRAEGVDHPERMAARDLYAETLQALETALAEETSAKYWIDRR